MTKADKSLYSPRGIFVDINNNVYVSYVESFVVLKTGQVWFSNRDSNWFGNAITFSMPSSLFVTSNGDVYIDNGRMTLIQKWTSDGTRTQINLPSDQSCHGLFVDIDDTLYCSVRDGHQIIKKSLENDATATWEIAAGNGTPKSAANTLDNPCGIFVDTNLDLYVADCNNNRIQLFKHGQQSGISVTNGTAPIGNYKLQCPTDIVLDADRNLYIVDSNSHRIIFVAWDSHESRCLVGCSSRGGSNLNELNHPTGISFDTFGNMFISDTGNGRVLKFELKAALCK